MILMNADLLNDNDKIDLEDDYDNTVCTSKLKNRHC